MRPVKILISLRVQSDMSFRCACAHVSEGTLLDSAAQIANESKWKCNNEYFETKRNNINNLQRVIMYLIMYLLVNMFIFHM